MRSRLEESFGTLKGRPHRLLGVGRKLNLKLWGRASVRLVLLAALVSVAVAGLLFLSAGPRDARVARAANPSTGTVGPTGPVLPVNGRWTGTATGGATASSDPLDGEAGCAEGTSCDTFTLTVLPGVYTGKVIHVDLSWTLPSNDYDLVIYKGGTCPATGKCTGQFISSSGNGATNGHAASQRPYSTNGSTTPGEPVPAGADAADAGQAAAPSRRDEPVVVPDTLEPVRARAPRSVVFDDADDELDVPDFLK